MNILSKNIDLNLNITVRYPIFIHDLTDLFNFDKKFTIVNIKIVTLPNHRVKMKPIHIKIAK